MKRKRDRMVQFLEIPEALNRGTASWGRSYRQQNTGTARRFVNGAVSGGSKGSPRDVRPPLGPNSFIFMPFFAKNCRCVHRTAEKVRPISTSRGIALIGIQDYFPKVNAQHSENETSFSSKQIPDIVRSSLAAPTPYPR